MANLLPHEGYYISSRVAPDVYAWIEVDGKPLRVYGAQEVYNKFIGYVEAKGGQQFVVCFADLRKFRPKHAHQVGLHIDGIDALVHASRYQKFTSNRNPYTGTIGMPYLFSKLESSHPDEAISDTERVVKGLSTVQLRYCRIDRIVLPMPKPGQAAADRVLRAHGRPYGIVAAAVQPDMTFDYIDPSIYPLFQFEFRYGSRHSPTPLPLLLPEASTSPVATPPTPVPFTSFAGPPAYASQPSQAAQAKADEERIARRARLAEELEMLRREQRIAVLEREIADLDRQIGSSGGGGSSSSSRKIKAEPSNAQRDAKRVKEETGEAPPAQSSGSGSGKGKEKERKGDMIVLSDSD
ncbi:hypothetical protein JCM5350_006025 [Sporobolomyces pararoseus]